MSEVCIGCGSPKAERNICCDACWKRIPTNLPKHSRWRTELRFCRSIGGYGWNIVEQIHNEIRNWLATHPKQVSPK